MTSYQELNSKPLFRGFDVFVNNKPSSVYPALSEERAGEIIIYLGLVSLQASSGLLFSRHFLRISKKVTRFNLAPQ